MASLYEIIDNTALVESVIDQMEESGAGDPETIEMLYSALLEQDASLSSKLEGYARLIKNAEAHAAMLKAEEQNLAARRRVAENRAKRLKAAVHQALEHLRLPKIQAGPFEFRVQANGGKAPLVLDPEVRPEARDSQFWRVEILDDTDAIRAALEAGEPVLGAQIGERGTHLRLS